MLVEKMQDRSVADFTSKNGSESIEVVKMYNKFNEVLNSIKELSAKMESKNQESTIDCPEFNILDGQNCSMLG